MVKLFLLVAAVVTIACCLSVLALLSSNIKIVNADVGIGEKEDHKSSEEHLIVLSKYKDGNIQLVPNPEDKQWKELSSEVDIQSIFGHKVSVNSLNNSTHLFFLLSWNDHSKTDDSNINTLRQRTSGNEIDNINTDGAVIIFEPQNEGEQVTTAITSPNHSHDRKIIANNNIESNDNSNNSPYIWYWSSAEKIANIHNKNQDELSITKSEWKNNQWCVIIGKRISPITNLQNNGNNNNINITNTTSIFKKGILQKDFARFAVWDTEKGESFQKIMATAVNNSNDDGKLPHADFILLSSLNIHPKDVYVWSAILIIGVIGFILLEVRLHKNSKLSEYNKERKEDEEKEALS
jgi:hypothetical protein